MQRHHAGHRHRHHRHRHRDEAATSGADSFVVPATEGHDEGPHTDAGVTHTAATGAAARLSPHGVELVPRAGADPAAEPSGGRVRSPEAVPTQTIHHDDGAAPRDTLSGEHLSELGAPHGAEAGSRDAGVATQTHAPPTASNAKGSVRRRPKTTTEILGISAISRPSWDYHTFGLRRLRFPFRRRQPTVPPLPSAVRAALPNILDGPLRRSVE